MADKRIYVVEEVDEKAGVVAEKLVKAHSQSQAVAHVVKGRFTAEIAKPDDIIRLMEAGVKPVEAGERMTINGGFYGEADASDAASVGDDEKFARLHYTEAAALIEKILRGYKVCDDGKRIAWRAARIIQKALDDARSGPMNVDKELASLGFPLPQDPIAGFANGACLDLRVRFAMQLLCSPAFNGCVSLTPKDVAHQALAVAAALFTEANERGYITPLPEGDALDEATRMHAQRAGRFQMEQQVGQKKAADEANGPIATLRRPGMNG